MNLSITPCGQNAKVLCLLPSRDINDTWWLKRRPSWWTLKRSHLPRRLCLKIEGQVTLCGHNLDLDLNVQMYTIHSLLIQLLQFSTKTNHSFSRAFFWALKPLVSWSIVMSFLVPRLAVPKGCALLGARQFFRLSDSLPQSRNPIEKTFLRHNSSYGRPDLSEKVSAALDNPAFRGNQRSDVLKSGNNYQIALQHWKSSRSWAVPPSLLERRASKVRRHQSWRSCDFSGIVDIGREFDFLESSAWFHEVIDYHNEENMPTL